MYTIIISHKSPRVWVGLPQNQGLCILDINEPPVIFHMQLMPTVMI